DRVVERAVDEIVVAVGAAGAGPAAPDQDVLAGPGGEGRSPGTERRGGHAPPPVTGRVVGGAVVEPDVGVASSPGPAPHDHLPAGPNGAGAVAAPQRGGRQLPPPLRPGRSRPRIGRRPE